MRSGPRLFSFVTCLVLASAPALAQESAIAGVVRDSSGAVLPGVTVDASSPALIEKSRVAVTDGAGQYRIIALVPGTYTVTFSLEGFSKVAREGIELRAETTLSVNADLRVGALTETITVTGASPVVDMQTVSAVTVMTREIMDAAPIQKNLQSVGILIPGTSLQTPQGPGRDVGGSAADQSPLSYRGSTASVTSVDGMRVSVLSASGQYGLFANDGGVQEISYNTGADSAEMGQAGLRINVIPKEGGNTFRGTISGNFTGGDAWNSYNIDDTLRARGLLDVSRIIHVYDANPTFGGPIRRNRLWFLSSARWLGVDRTVVDSYYDADPNPYRFAPDFSRPAVDDNRQTSFLNRLTWRATERNKVTGYIDKQTKFIGHYAVSSTNLPEASTCQCLPYQWVGNVKWTSTLSSRLLMESGWGFYKVEWDNNYQPHVTPTTYRINNQLTGQSFAAAAAETRNISALYPYSIKLTWVSGTHTVSGGLNGNRGSQRTVTTRNGELSVMRFGNATVNADPTGYGPNQITMNLPTDSTGIIKGDNGFWVTDRITYKRATMTAGLRFDWFLGAVGESSVLPNRWSPDRTYAGFGNAPNWKDLSPRLGFAYDLFGNGRTALKVGASKYLNAQTINLANSLNPIATLTGNASLAWTDNSRDYTIFNPDGSVQDIDFNPRAPIDPATGLPQNELAPLPASSTFGQLVPSTTISDLKIREGYGVRGYSWEFTTGIQHELLPRVSVGFNYYRRPTAGNQLYTDNINVGPQQYQGPYCVTTPVDPRLPDGGGWQLCDIYQLTAAGIATPTQNVQTFTKTHLEGTALEPIVYNHGFDLTVNARTAHGTILQGGINGDRAITDDCYQAAIGNPQTLQNNPITGRPFCHSVTPFRPDIKVVGVQTLPWWNLTAAATYQRVLGPPIQATWTVTQAIANQHGWAITTAAGSTPAQIAAATTNFNLFQTGQKYGEAMNQLDLRLSKSITLGGNRLQINADAFNALNDNWVYGQNNTLGTGYAIAATWQRPTQVLQARMFKIGGQFDF